MYSERVETSLVREEANTNPSCVVWATLVDIMAKHWRVKEAETTTQLSHEGRKKDHSGTDSNQLNYPCTIM